jgi:hypothetical protein
MQNFKTLRQPLLGELAMSRKKEEEERKKEEKIMPSTMATYVYASSQGQRTHSARTNSGQLWWGGAQNILGPKQPKIRWSSIDEEMVNKYFSFHQYAIYLICVSYS